MSFYSGKTPMRNKVSASSQHNSMEKPSPAVTSEPHSLCPRCEVVRFVLISGAALELTADSIEEVVETWADKCCKAVTGCKVDGTQVAFLMDRIDYMEGVTDAHN